MNIASLVVRVSVVLALAVATSTRSEQIVEFKATITNSPFATPGYAVGNVVTGWYAYDPAATPFELGFNYAMYQMPGMHLSFGEVAYEAMSGGRLNVVHFLPEITPNAVDLYDLLGFTLSGPVVEGFSPAFSELKLTDTDNSAYANLHPVPIDLPDPGVFEIQELKIGFLSSPPIVAREIHAQINSIKKVLDGSDSEPPKILSLSANPGILWPPNGKMVRVQIVVVAKDNVGVVSSKIISVASNESAESFRSGNKAGPNWLITGSLTLALRAERTGTTGGRIYDIAVECSDAAGNTSIGHTQVRVPQHADGRRDGAQ
jgi:hypothetical protein